ncbi:MAG: hypothetical protein ACI9WU_002214 [Myxococcota bacterium]|jgi:hypothetical protein
MAWSSRPVEPTAPKAPRLSYEVLFERDGGSWDRRTNDDVSELAPGSTFVMKVVPQARGMRPGPISIELQRASGTQPYKGTPTIKPNGEIVVHGTVGVELPSNSGAVTLVVRGEQEILATKTLMLRPKQTD